MNVRKKEDFGLGNMRMFYFRMKAESWQYYKTEFLPREITFFSALRFIIRTPSIIYNKPTLKLVTYSTPSAYALHKNYEFCVPFQVSSFPASCTCQVLLTWLGWPPSRAFKTSLWLSTETCPACTLCKQVRGFPLYAFLLNWDEV